MKNKKLEEENKKLKIVNEKINSKLLKENQIKSNFQNIQIDGDEIKNLKYENEKLKHQLSIKDNEIKELKIKNQNNIILDRPKCDINDIIVINFMSQDSTIDEGVKCHRICEAF